MVETRGISRYGLFISKAPIHSLQEDIVDETKNARSLATALEQARSAYLALANEANLPHDAVLARSPDYRRLLMAGCQIRALGNRMLFLRTMHHLFTEDPALSARAAGDLGHLWAGLADWPDDDRQTRMN